jgi:septal ring-binding cell division protein DamX
MTSRPVRGLTAAAALVLALAWGSTSVMAQSDPRLVDAVRAAQEGRGDSARTIVDRLLAATPPTDTLFPQILYTQAMVAGTAGDMRRLLQRVTVEYGTSSWADDALLRLVQMDYATRNFDGAARNLERLKLDFPATPLLPQAAYWAGRTYFDANNPAAACRWLADGMAQARNDVEVQNQLGYLYQRCDLRADAGAQAAATDTGRVDSTGRVPPGTQAASTPPSGAASPGAPSPGAPTPGAPSPGAPPPGTPSPAAPPIGAAPTPAPVPIQPPSAADAPPSAANPAPAAANAPSTAAPPPASPPAAAGPAARTVYRVQIAAVATRKGAEDAARKARPLGLSVITVEEKGLYKVRLGEYPTREAAQNAAASLKARLGGSPFVVAGP